ncbi:nickel-dependent hydrogenase large subunit [Thermococcus celericrescens]|uniref:nickel-dependent hydrogenase large subunit n=1 Tax=Thermococcus celericrescens TaxID=227598 RepID=UPI001FE19C5E|nr:nickel-dependent hydrogenase large subunit [Thermococcus celericrescens]
MRRKSGEIILGGIELGKVCRVSGDAKLVMYEEGGEVQDALFISTAPVRGFEKMVIGKSPFFVVEAVMRICGLCHASHGIAAAEAIENAIGVKPPKNGVLLREALGLINRIQSHLLEFLMVVPDLVVPEEREKLILRLIDFHTKIGDFLLKLGGAMTHPPNLTVGGINPVPKWSVFNNLKARLPKTLRSWNELAHLLVDEDIQTDVAMELREKKLDNRYLSSGLFYGDRFNIDVRKIKLIPYYEFRKDNPSSKESTTMIAMYKGKPVEVGPRARLSTYREKSYSTLYDLHTARVDDVSIALHRLSSILDSLDMKEPFRNQNIVFGPGKGVGVYEAPRGTLVHIVELGEEGRTLYSRIVVPTMFNIPVMEESVKGLSVEAAEAVVRLYDPCIPCTTHVARLRR